MERASLISSEVRGAAEGFLVRRPLLGRGSLGGKKWSSSASQILCLFFLFFHFFFFHAFIVFRYKKLRAALAMERTKPINQNFKIQETISSCPPCLLKVLRPKTDCPSFPTEAKYKEITTLELLLIYAFFGGESYVKEKTKTTS